LKGFVYPLPLLLEAALDGFGAYVSYCCTEISACPPRGMLEQVGVFLAQQSWRTSPKGVSHLVRCFSVVVSTNKWMWSGWTA